MPTLFDAIQNIRSRQPAPQQQELQRIARARGGKAQAVAGPQTSVVGEQRALTAGRTAAQQQALAGGLAAQGLAQQRQQTTQQQALAGQAQQQQFQESLAGLAQQATLGQETLQQRGNLAQQRLASDRQMQLERMSANTESQLMQLASNRGVQVDNMFQQFRQSNQSLEDRRDAAQLEQLGFMYSLSDRKYMNSLSQIGQQRNLENNIAFAEEAVDIELGADLERVVSDLDLKSALMAEERDLERELAKMGADSALEIGRAATRAGAITSMISGGVDMFAASQKGG